MRSNRDQAVDLLQELQENGVSAQSILDFVLTHSLSGDYALFAMRDAKAEFLEDEDEEVDGSSWRDNEDFFDEEEEDYNSALLYGVDNNQ
jgi:hypothetical protein